MSALRIPAVSAVSAVWGVAVEDVWDVSGVAVEA